MSQNSKNQIIIIKNDDIVSRLLSRPSSLLVKVLYTNRNAQVFDTKSIDKKTLNTIKELSKYSPNTKIYVGTSPVLDAISRAVLGQGVAYQPILLRPFGTIIAGLGGVAGKLSGSDYYSPAADIVSIRSNIPAIAAHEIGHAVDFHKKSLPTVYNILTSAPLTRLIPEAAASSFAGEKLKKDRDSLKILTPAYGGYVSSALGIPLVGILAGHLLKNKYYFGMNKDKKRNR